MVRATLLLMLVIFCENYFAQSPAQFFARGEQLASQDDWAGASPYLQHAYSLDSSRLEYIYFFGRSLIELHDYERALPMMQRSYQLDLGAIYTDDLYWVGFLHFHLGHDIEAIQTLKAWLKKSSSRSENRVLEFQAKNIIASAEWKASHADFSLLDSIGKYYLNEAKSLRRSHLTCAAIRSDDGEQSPKLVDTLLYYSQWHNDAWHMNTALVQGDSLVLSTVASLAQIPKGIGQVTQLGSRCVGVLMDGASTLMEWKSSDPGVIVPWVSLGDPTFKATNPHLAVVQGDTVLFFAAQAAAGDFDLYAAKLEGRHWTSAVALGKDVNTAGDEISPFYADGFLFFSSDGWPGYGGHDVYRTKLNGNSARKPESLGSEINSVFNERGFGLYQGDKREEIHIFWTSNATEDQHYQGACCQHLHGIRLEADTTSTSSNSDDGDTSESGGEDESSFFALPPCRMTDQPTSLRVMLYFHNDEPDPDTWLDQSTWTYQRAYDSFMAIQPKYQRGKTAASLQAMNAFFADQVVAGWKRLDSLYNLMEQQLVRGDSVTIKVRGFASPRAQSLYNVHLSNRRISSFVNELKMVQGGNLAKYMASAKNKRPQLAIVYLPLGESTSKAGVSDQIDDEPRSIYSLDAALERRIEIEADFSHALPRYSFRVSKDTIDFGVIPMTGSVEETITIQNVSNKTLVLLDAVAECGCTEPMLASSTVPANQSTSLRIGFNPVGHAGVQEKCVWIFAEGEEPYRVVVRAERRQ